MFSLAPWKLKESTFNQSNSNHTLQNQCRAEKDYDDQVAEKSSLTPECKRHLAKKLSSYLDR